MMKYMEWKLPRKFKDKKYPFNAKVRRNGEIIEHFFLTSEAYEEFRARKLAHQLFPQYFPDLLWQPWENSIHYSQIEGKNLLEVSSLMIKKLVKIYAILHSNDPAIAYFNPKDWIYTNEGWRYTSSLKIGTGITNDERWADIKNLQGHLARKRPYLVPLIKEYYWKLV